MTYEWSALVFVERWRTHYCRGIVFGMYRPGDQTTFDLRIQGGEWGQTPGLRAVEVRLVDVGDLIREKRIPLTATVSMIVQVAAQNLAATERREKGFVRQAESRGGRPRLDPGARLAGRIEEIDSEHRALVDVGLPLVVDVEGAPGWQGWTTGDWVEFDVAAPLRGYLIVS